MKTIKYTDRKGLSYEEIKKREALKSSSGINKNLPKENKYKNKKCVIDGIKFDSKKESNRYLELKYLERAGEIENLELQPVFEIVVNGQKICKYTADFRYSQNGKVIVEDVKSKPTKTPVYRLKKKLVRACFGLEITEV